MPAPADRRRSDLEAALRLMVETVGDDPLNSHAFSPSQARFRELLATTWRELLDSYWIEDRGEKPGPSFRLTPSGWLEGLRLAGRLDNHQTKERAIAIRKELKAQVKGRQSVYDAQLHVQALAESVHLPIGWVWNAMRADLLARLFPESQMNAELDRSGLLVRIPPTFDMQRTD